MNIHINPAILAPVRAQILSVGTFLPEERIKSDDIMTEVQSEQKYGLPHNWMSTEMGIEERRSAPDKLLPSDLAIFAAEDAFNSNPDFNPGDIDCVIFCGIERDRPEPATAHNIQNALGLNANHVFDVANACYGFVDGIKLANALIESRMIEHALVVTGEVPTRILKAVVEMMKKGIEPTEVKHMWGWLSVGDAGGAVILGPSSDPNSGFVGFNQRVDSRQVNRCHYRFRADGSIDGKMQMAQVVARGFQLNKDMFDDTLKLLRWDGLDWALTHQTGKRTFEQVLTLKSINKEKLIQSYPKLGNITTATLPICLKKMLKSGKVKKGDRIGGLFAGSGIVTGQFGYVV